MKTIKQARRSRRTRFIIHMVLQTVTFAAAAFTLYEVERVRTRLAAMKR